MAKKVIKKAVKKPAQKAAKKAAPAKKVAKKLAKKAVKKPAKKVAKKPVKKPVKKPLKKAVSAKKTVKKTVKKVTPAPKKTPAKPTAFKIVKAPRNVKPVPEEGREFKNSNPDFALAFAEQMKRRIRKADEEAAAKAGIRLSRRPTTRKQGKETMKFPAADLNDFKKRLLALRQEAIGQSATLKTVALEQTEERGNEEEDGSDAFLRLQNLSQVDSRNRVIQKIDEALARIADGTYGICEMCGQLIRKPRLLNLPFAHTCMECQLEMERP